MAKAKAPKKTGKHVSLKVEAWGGLQLPRGDPRSAWAALDEPVKKKVRTAA